VKATGLLRYGGDKEGGGPYIFPDPAKPRDVTGFEVDLMAALARSLGAAPEFAQGQWDRLLQNLDTGRIDLVCNGYEWTEVRASNYLSTRPYYLLQLELMAPRGGALRAWDDVKRPRPDGRRWKVGVLGGSSADGYAEKEGGASVEVVRFDGATDAMTAVANGQIDATLQDLPAAIYYRDRFPTLMLSGDPVGRFYCVLYTRRDDVALRDALDRGLDEALRSGAMRTILDRYGIWTEAQTELIGLDPASFRKERTTRTGGFALIRQYAPLLRDAALVTIALSVSSMPLAMLIGLAVALGRLYGPALLRPLLTAYVELLRGTPLMLQLYVLFYVLKLPPWVAGILGLAINYSAYEAEIYRAGLQAIPQGQMEAALALGMSRGLALRRIIVPQAVRIVIPPVTNDFIALFKDTSVCSVITLVELTKQYSILANSTGGVVEFALATAALYMVMSLPLSWFSRWSERRLGDASSNGGTLA
ncbi:MAG: ABC transporter permease subunit, partial [Thermoleophilia bacterium]|nr:ABC transporter permease subunit [Thermoleophilia bacterium]